LCGGQRPPFQADLTVVASHDPTVIAASYDSAAGAYVEHLYAELTRKPLDRHLLNRFAEEVCGQGLVADLGCGPGHVARYLHDQGATVLGIDLSPEMIRWATRLNPPLSFCVGDMRSIDMCDGALVGIISFYSIVHFEPDELRAVMVEFRRLLSANGVLLIAFHVGEQTVHVDELFGQQVSLDFRFHVPADVVRTLSQAGFTVMESTEREPYDGAEYPSRRCYLFARAA
jgi:SAM-dependent methyltransferase